MDKSEEYHLEYLLRGRSVSNLWASISTESGLSRWFADQAELINPELYRFSWDGNHEDAEVVDVKPNESIRFRWLEEEDDHFFEFAIHIDEVTHVLSLRVTDFAEPDERDDAERLWNKQVELLLRYLGA